MEKSERFQKHLAGDWMKPPSVTCQPSACFSALLSSGTSDATAAPTLTSAGAASSRAVVTFIFTFRFVFVAASRSSAVLWHVKNKTAQSKNTQAEGGPGWILVSRDLVNPAASRGESE